jgi:site-specific recombinase XerD
VTAILNATKNGKHQTILLLIYTCGLRVGELVNLMLSDIRYEQGYLRVRQGKGHRDRTVDLPSMTQDALRAYTTYYQPSKYLFEGMPKNNAYSVSSVRKIVKRSAKQAGLNMDVYPHLLRHSYATHHLDSGTDIVLIKQQLGHSSLQVTARYLHLCKRRPKMIQHPIDSMAVQLVLMPSANSCGTTAKTTSDHTDPPSDISN